MLKNLRWKQTGFSLMELLVVLLIIGLLAGLVAPRFMGHTEKARKQVALTQVKTLKSSLETLYLDIGRFPTTDEGLALLRSAPTTSNTGQDWKGPYIEEQIPTDPWGNAYQYEFIGNAQGLDRPFYLYSLGADAKKGGDGDGKDIGYAPN